MEKDPGFARAYSGLADGYLLLGYYGYLDFAGAEAEYRRAIELNPSYVTALQWYGLLLLERQRFDEARAVLRRARDLDPLSPLILSNAADAEFFSRRYDEAIRQYQAVLEREPAHAFSLLGLGRTWRQQGSYDRAIAALGKARAASPADPVMLAHLSFALARAGRRGEAEAIRDRLRPDASRGGPFAYAMAVVGAGPRRPGRGDLVAHRGPREAPPAGPVDEGRPGARVAAGPTPATRS